MTTAQIRLVRGLLAKAGLTDQKEEIAFDYSNGRSTGLTDLNYSETKALIKFLNSQLNQKQLKKDKMVNKILSLAHEMRWELPSGKIDMKHVNDFCLTRTAEKKPLNKFSLEELPALVTIFEKVYISFIKSI